MSTPLVSDQLIAKAAERTGIPSPSDIAPDAPKFEQWIAGGLAPVLGLNLCLLGCWCLGQLTESLPYAAIASLTLGMLAMGAVYRSAYIRTYSDYLGIGLAGCILAIALFQPALTALVASAAVAGLFGLVYARQVHGRAFVLLAAWLPVVLERGHVSFAALLCTALLGPSATLLLRRRFTGAAFVVIAVILLRVSWELGQQQRGGLSLMLLAGVALGLAILYELTVPTREFSTFRVLLGQAPVVAATAVLVWATLPRDWPARPTIWTFAACVIAYQGGRTLLERAAVPTRLAWVGLALAVSAAVEAGKVSVPAIACQIIFVAAALHLTAVLLAASVLADSGIFLLAGVLAALFFSKAPTSLPQVIASGLAGVALVLASRRFAVNDALPWWSGFLRKQHATLAATLTSKILQRVGELTVVKIFFGWVGLLIVWVRFAWEAAAKSDIRAFVNLAGHAWLALFSGRQLVEWLARWLPNREASFESVFTGVLCSAYGVALFARGLRTGRRFTRFLALTIIIAPALMRAPASKSIPLDELAWLLLTTGSALAAVGLLTKRGAAVAVAPTTVD